MVYVELVTLCHLTDVVISMCPLCKNSSSCTFMACVSFCMGQPQERGYLKVEQSIILFMEPFLCSQEQGWWPR